MLRGRTLHSHLRELARLLPSPAPHPLHLRQLARTSGVALQAAQRELPSLTELGVVRRAPRGREVYVHVQEAHPLVGPLRTLLQVARATSPPSPFGEPPSEPFLPSAPDPAGRQSQGVW